MLWRTHKKQNINISLKKTEREGQPNGWVPGLTMELLVMKAAFLCVVVTEGNRPLCLRFGGEFLRVLHVEALWGQYP